MILGIDVSHWRGFIDWPLVEGIDFAITKATEYGVYMGGAYQVDPTLGANWHGAQDNGIVPGAFMMFRENIDGKAQAELFMDAMEEHTGDKQRFVWIDYERDDGAANSTSAKNLQECIFAIWYRWGFLPAGIYTSRNRWKALIEVYGHAPAWAHHLALWMAYYGNNDGSIQAQYLHNNIPHSWVRPMIWQYTSYGAVPGINGGDPPVDMNIFMGSGLEFGQLAGTIPTDRQLLHQHHREINELNKIAHEHEEYV